MDATEVDFPAKRAGHAFVGRRRELSELRASVGDVIAGHGRLVLVGGESGIGKTRLAEELSVRASGADALVLWGRSWEGGEAPAFWPWVQILRGYARRRPSAELAAELGACAPFVVHLVPELRERLPDLSDADLPSASEEARFALFDAVTDFLVSASGSAPLVLVLDDLHAADASSLLLLQFLARQLATARILVVGTYRDVGVAPAPDVAAPLGELVRAAQHIILRGLHVDEVARFVAQASGSPPGAEATASIHRATGGNPLFLGQVVQLLVGEGRLPLEGPLPTPLPLPPGVREAIGARVALLPERAADTLTIGSVIGDEPPVPLLQAVSGRDLESLLAHLAGAVDAGLLVERANGPARFRFAHALIREALYGRLGATAQMRLHRDVGRAIERLYEAVPGPQVRVLAQHFCRAAPLGDAERGVGYAVRAGERAMAQLAYAPRRRSAATSCSAWAPPSNAPAARSDRARPSPGPRRWPGRWVTPSDSRVPRLRSAGPRRPRGPPTILASICSKRRSRRCRPTTPPSVPARWHAWPGRCTSETSTSERSGSAATRWRWPACAATKRRCSRRSVPSTS